MSTMLSRPIFDKCDNYVERFVIRSGYSELSRWKMNICTNLSQNLCDGGWNIFGISNLWNNVYNGVEAVFDKCANYVERFVVKWELANFQGGKWTFARIYFKISAMEGEMFLALLIFGTISTMVSRRIFDKCSNFVERFVIKSGYCVFSRWKMYLCTNLSPNLCDGGWNILGIFHLWNNVYNGV